MYKVGNKKIKDMVDADKKWQKLRDELRGTWKKQPIENVIKLRKYLGNINKTSNEKLAIVLNYLTGTGFRTKQITHPEIDILRNEIKEEMKKRINERKK